MRILTGGDVHTMAGPKAEAVAFDLSGIVAVGSHEEVLAKASAHGGASAPCVEELAGHCVVPGFIDAHHHMSLALLYEGCSDLGSVVQSFGFSMFSVGSRSRCRSAARKRNIPRIAASARATLRAEIPAPRSAWK